MTQEVVIDIAQQALLITLYISAPMLGLGLLVGLAISIFQATTQIQEQTLTFVPKMIAILGAIIVFGPWMLTTIIEYTTNLYLNVGQYIK